MALLTASDYIYNAFRRMGQLRPGYTTNNELMTDALDAWRILFDGLNAKRTMQYSIPDFIYPVVSSGLDGIYGENVQFSVGPVFTFSATTTSTSTTALVTNTAGLNIGQRISGTGIATGSTIQGISTNTSIVLSDAATASGATTVTVTPDFIGPRPEAIIRMNLLLTSASPAQPSRIPLAPMSAEEWANLPVVQFSPVDVTTAFYYDPQFPQGVINVFPPLNGNSLEFFTWGVLTPPTSLTASYSAPPGYADLIIWELAKVLWPMATKNLMVNRVSHQWICGQAKLARDAVRAVNAPMPRMRNDFTGGGGSRSNSCDWDLLLTGVPY